MTMEKNFLCRNKECTNGNFGKRKRFDQSRPNEIVCSPECATALTQQKMYVKKREQEIRKENARIKKELFTVMDYVKELTTVFNSYIRERDKNNGCISCGREMSNNERNAGHYWNTKYSFLRFNEDNVNLQCARPCNKDLHGNFGEYRIRLIEKIGLEAVEWLDEHRNDKVKWDKEQLKEMIIYYKQKLIALKNSEL